jgi:hypothetical protein
LVAPRVHLKQTLIEQPKKPQNILGDPSMIHLIHQTCVKLTCKEVMKLNDVVHKQDARPLIEIMSEPIMVGKWFFDTGAGISCLSLQQFRLIPIEKEQH